MGRNLSHRQLSVLFALAYLEGSDEYQRGAWISYTRLSASYDGVPWLSRETLDEALATLEGYRLVKLSHPVRSVVGVQLTKAGRRIAARISPLAGALWLGNSLVNRPY